MFHPLALIDNFEGKLCPCLQYFLFSASIQSVNRVAVILCIKARRHGQEVQLLFSPNIRLQRKSDLSDFDCGMIVGARLGGLIRQKLLISQDFSELGEKDKKKHPLSHSFVGRGQRMTGWSDLDKNQITRYYSVLQKSMSKHSTLNFEVDGRQQETMSCHLRTRSLRYSGNRLTRIGQWKMVA